MTTPTNEPTAIARQRELVRTFRHVAHLWADTQQQEGQRYNNNAQEYGEQSRQSNQSAQNQHSLIEKNREQVLYALTPVGLVEELREQLETSFKPTIDDSTKQPLVELESGVGMLTTITENIQRSAKGLAAVQTKRIHVRRSKTNLIIFSTGILILIFLVSNFDQIGYPNVLAMIILLILIILIYMLFRMLEL